jgi:hypothetical protein
MLHIILVAIAEDTTPLCRETTGILTLTVTPGLRKAMWEAYSRVTVRRPGVISLMMRRPPTSIFSSLVEVKRFLESMGKYIKADKVRLCPAIIGQMARVAEE